MKEHPDQDGSESAIFAARRAKAERLRARGDNPFANDLDASGRSTLRAVRDQFSSALLEPTRELRYDAARVSGLTASGKNLIVVGRIMARRGFGKASFLRIRDESHELQLFAKADVMGEAFHALEDIDLGDHVEARGTAMVTKTGELSLQLSKLRILTKALRPLPDKWHGLSDIDLRHRRRYVDLIANPTAGHVLKARSAIVAGLRDFLDGQGFLEVETPTLHGLVSGAAARPFVTHHNALDLELFLRIAPELHLKRLLVGGFERVYEIGRCYRNEGISTRHNPEFTMLEFYRAYATYETLMDLTEELLRHVDAFVERRFGEWGLDEVYGAWRLERAFTLGEPYVRVTMREALRTAWLRAGLPSALLERFVVTGAGGPEDTSESATATRSIDWRALDSALESSSNAGERVFALYEYVAEPFLVQDYRTGDGRHSLPVFIIDYPAEVSPLARRKDGDPTLTDRFELFVDGRELCNAFSELNDPEDQAARFREQLEKKARGDAETMDYDADYILALEYGMPPAAGFGLGVDRLVMMLTGQASIREVLAFPLLRPESASNRLLENDAEHEPLPNQGDPGVTGT